MSCNECWIGDKAPKIQRSSCTSRWYCKRWFWLLCSIHWTRIFSISNDSRQHHGYHFQIAWLRWTSSRRSISLYLGKNGRCSKITENSKIGMSRHLDSSTTTQMARIMVQFGKPSRYSWAKSVRSFFGRTVMGKAIWENPVEVRLGKGFHLGMLIRTPWKRVVLICVCWWHQVGWKETIDPMWKVLNKEVDLGEPTSFLDRVYLGCTQRQCELSKDIVDNYWTMFESRINAEWTEKLPYSENLHISSCSFDMDGHAKKCVERYCELANKTTQQLCKVSTPCIDDHHFKEEETKSVGELHKYALELFWNAYTWHELRPDIPWSVNKLAPSITKWTRACDKRLSLLISYIHHTSEYKQCYHLGNTAKQCRLGLFQDSDFAKDLEDSKSISGGTLCIFGSHTFVPISWMYKKQTSVSHSSTESEIISLDAGLRMDGIPALELWELIATVLHGNTNQS